MSTATLMRRLFGSARASLGQAGGELMPGAVFRNATNGETAEVARVIEVRGDRFGIVHVRFDLVRQYHGMAARAGERTLAAQAFRKRFPIRMDSPGP